MLYQQEIDRRIAELSALVAQEKVVRAPQNTCTSAHDTMHALGGVPCAHAVASVRMCEYEDEQWCGFPAYERMRVERVLECMIVGSEGMSCAQHAHDSTPMAAAPSTKGVRALPVTCTHARASASVQTAAPPMKVVRALPATCTHARASASVQAAAPPTKVVRALPATNTHVSASVTVQAAASPKKVVRALQPSCTHVISVSAIVSAAAPPEKVVRALHATCTHASASAQTPGSAHTHLAKPLSDEDGTCKPGGPAQYMKTHH